ncbi:neutral amino acid transporter, partial [Podila humilis]
MEPIIPFENTLEDLPEPRQSISDSSSRADTTTTTLASSSADADVNRSRSTRRLLSPLAINTATAGPPVDEDQLLAIVGQHLAVTPTITGAEDSFPSSPLSGKANSDRERISPILGRLDASDAAGLSTSTLTPSTVIDMDGTTKPTTANGATIITTTTTTTTTEPVNQEQQQQLQQQRQQGSPTPSEGTHSTTAILDSPSHFQLQGGDAANEVYKWHAKETTRRQVNRSQTYHGVSPSANQEEGGGTSAAADMVQMKTPGGFRRHFIKQDAAARGEPAPKLATKSFIHFLGLFNMYEMDHFAGENFHSIPRRSIIVPRDMEKRRMSLASVAEGGVGAPKRYMHPGEHIDDDEEVIEEPEEKISFGKAVGMLFKSFIASGILFLPNAFKNGGILFSPLFMTLIAGLCLHSFLLLVKCRELHPGSFGEIGGHFYGRWMR